MLMTEYDYDTDIQVQREEAAVHAEDRLTMLINKLTQDGLEDSIITIKTSPNYDLSLAVIGR